MIYRKSFGSESIGGIDRPQMNLIKALLRLNEKLLRDFTLNLNNSIAN